MKDIVKAKEILKQGHTCVLVKGDKHLISDDSGISPVMNWIKQNKNLEGFSVADKIVGKAVALLFVKVGVKEVFAEVLSKSAKSVLGGHKIPYSCELETEKIINRAGTGICPMEQCVEKIDDCEEAYVALQNKLIELRNKNQKSSVW